MSILGSQLQSLVKFLSQEKIKYVILGGVAVSVYGEPRMTMDIDVNILLNKIKIDYFIAKSKKYGFCPLFKAAGKLAQKTGVVSLGIKKGGITGKFDIIFAENVLEENAIKRGKIKTIDGVKVKLVTPEDLIIHKIASSRPRDHEDLSGILIRQAGKLDLKYVRFWLKKIDSVNEGTSLALQFDNLQRKTK